MALKIEMLFLATFGNRVFASRSIRSMELTRFIKQEKSLLRAISSCRIDEEPLLFEKVCSVRETIGMLLVDRALSSCAQANQIAIIINPVKRASFAQFLRHDTQSKKMTIRARTASETIRKGFIFAEEGSLLSTGPLTFHMGQKLFFAYKRNGCEYISSCPQNDEPLHVCQYPDGMLITSDIDALLIASKNLTASYWDPDFGEVSQEEKMYLSDANRHFLKLIEAHYPDHPLRPQIALFNHGPANRSPISEQSHLHFPMTAYFPNGDINKFGCEDARQQSLDAFVDLVKGLEKQNFLTCFNPRWDLESL